LSFISWTDWARINFDKNEIKNGSPPNYCFAHTWKKANIKNQSKPTNLTYFLFGEVDLVALRCPAWMFRRQSEFQRILHVA
jgi:hypothetical protein